MVQRFNYEQWKKLSLNVNKTKQSMQQLSKLYIIAHEKVKQIMRKCQIDFQYDPTQDSQRQLQFLKAILQRLANRNSDQYLSNVDPAALDRYEQNFYDLIQLLRLALYTHHNREKLDVNKLTGISQIKTNKNDEFSLKNQLKRSQDRMIRTRSGHRITKNIKKQTKKFEQEQQELHQQQKPQEEEYIPSNNQIILIDPAEHTEQFLKRKAKLENIINEQIDVKNYSLNFQKKYSNLNEYFQQRKQIADLIFSQKYYDQMIQISKTRKNEPKIQQKKDPDLNKLFPQFNIKTKYLKKQVKQNILKVIFDVKKQLLKQYHQANVTKMKQASQQNIIKPISKKKFYKTSISEYSEPSTARNIQARFKSTNRLKQTTDMRRKSLGNLKFGHNPRLSWRQDEGLIKQQKKAGEMFVNSKMPLYKK